MHDPPQDYAIRFAVPIASVSGERTGPLDYVTAVRGSIEHGRTEGELTRVGKFSFQHVRVAWARLDGVPLADVFGIDSEWRALYPLLFDPTSERLSGIGAAAPSDVLFIDELSLLPAHRGHRLAGSIVDRIASLEFGKWGALVVRAAPEPVERGEWPDLVYAQPFCATGEAAKKKLRVYWAGFGFRPLGGKTDFMVRDATTLEAAPASLRAI
jgi:hypothetical protein